MTSLRSARILAELDAARPPHPRRLCAVAVRVVGVAGAAISVEGAGHDAPLCSSDAVAARVEDLSFTLGEGPRVDAHRDGAPVAEPDLARPRSQRWPSFTPLAVDAGVAAVFSFPLRLGTVRLGALTLHQTRRGRLSDDQHADALAMADVVFSVVLGQQAGASPGLLGAGLDPLSRSRAEVHQASGMLAAQLGVSVAEALVRLRAHAYADERTLAEVACDVVSGRLRLGR